MGERSDWVSPCGWDGKDWPNDVVPDDAVRAVQALARMADALSWQTGEPGTEIAGGLLSCMAGNEGFCRAVLARGTGALFEPHKGVDWATQAGGTLTFRTRGGDIMSPDEAAAARDAESASARFAMPYRPALPSEPSDQSAAGPVAGEREAG